MELKIYLSRLKSYRAQIQILKLITPKSITGAILGLFWAHFGTIWEHLWDHFGTILEPFWDNLGAILGLFRDHFDTILKPFLDPFGTVLGLFCDHFGIILGPCSSLLVPYHSTYPLTGSI